MPKRADLRAVGEFAASRHGVFTVSQAADHGITRRDITTFEGLGVVERVRQNVWRFVAYPTTWRQTLAAATVETEAVASHRSAAALLRIDGLTKPPDEPELLCSNHRRIEFAGARVHRTRELPEDDITAVNGIPCTTMARTLCDIAASVSPKVLVRALDHAQRSGAPLDVLLDRSTGLSRRGRSGPPLVADLVRRRMDGYRMPESYFERVLGECLRSPLLPGLVRQHTLHTPAGLFIARFDLALPWARLGIEAHSRSYHLGAQAERYDEDRDMRAAQQGWEIAYLGFAATRAPHAVRRDIELLVARRAADLGLSPPPQTTA
jgi:very-short-patch-repair endonuclease